MDDGANGLKSRLVRISKGTGVMVKQKKLAAWFGNLVAWLSVEQV